MDSQLLLHPQESAVRSPVVHALSPQTSHHQETAAVQTTTILPAQSLSFVEIFLNAAIASILYTRQLLKHDSAGFSDRCVADLLGWLGPVTYTDFLCLDSQAGYAKSQPFKILVKGKSQRADKILTLLEGGIFDALQNGYLEAIQLSICTDSSRPAEVIECYTFTFTYSSSSGKSGHDVSSITVSTNSHELLIVGDAQKSFNAAIKGLLKFIRGLPQLPRRRNLGLNLFYTDNCPPSYEPQGFSSCVDDDLYFPDMPGLARKSTKPSRLVVGAHRIGVVVSHVDSEEGQDQLRVIPQDIDYPTKRSRLDEYNVTSEEITIHHVDPSSQSLPVSLQPPARNDMMASPAAPSTQTRHDIETKEALQQMQRSSSKPKDLIPTQNLFNADDVDSEDSNNPADQSYMNAICSSTPDALSRKRMIVPAKMAELMIHVRAVQQRCTVGDRVFDQDALDKYEIKRKVTPNVIKCECRDNSDDDGGIMLFCEICGTWQHQFCYGWDAFDEVFRPVEHVCYSCLLLPEEKDLNDWMPVLVACRNALNYIYTNGFSADNNYCGLAKAMRFKGDPKDVMKSKVMQILFRQNLFETSPRLRVIQTNIQKGTAEYLNPLASLFHHYQDRNDNDPPLPSITERAVASHERAYHGFALDAIRTYDSFGDEVIRYGYYPRLAAVRSRKRKRSASVAVEDSQDAFVAAGVGLRGEGGPSKFPRPRKMSRSEMVCLDETSASETQSDVVMESEDEEDMYN